MQIDICIINMHTEIFRYKLAIKFCKIKNKRKFSYVNKTVYPT